MSRTEYVTQDHVKWIRATSTPGEARALALGVDVDAWEREDRARHEGRLVRAWLRATRGEVLPLP